MASVFAGEMPPMASEAVPSDVKASALAVATLLLAIEASPEFQSR